MENQKNRYFYKIETVKSGFDKWYKENKKDIIKIKCRINDEDVIQLKKIFKGIEVCKKDKKSYESYNFIQLKYDNKVCKDDVMNHFVVIINKIDVEDFVNELKKTFIKIDFKKTNIYTYSLTINYIENHHNYTWKDCSKGLKPKYPIGILSYQRYNEYGRTHLLLTKMKINHYLFVEPCEYDKYKEFYNSKYCELIKCPDDFHSQQMGSTPVRNYMIEYFKEKGYKYFWMLDDNIKSYRRFHNGKKKDITSPVIFTSIENYIDNYDNVGLAGHNFNPFVVEGTERPVLIKNSKIYSSFLIRTDTEIRFNHRHQEDNFISIDYIEKGYCNLCFNHILYDKNTSGIDKGGNSEEIYKREDKFIGYKERYDYFYETVKKMIENKEITLIENKTIDDVFNRVELKSKEYHARINYKYLKGYNENNIYLKPIKKRVEAIQYDDYLIKRIRIMIKY